MGARLLLVEDDPTICEALTLALTMPGYDVAVAIDGLSALGILGTLTPSLILLDLRLPDIDGVEVAAELRHLGRSPRIPLLIMSADPRGPEEARSMGAEGYIDKPFPLGDLLLEVERLANPRGPIAERAAAG